MMHISCINRSCGKSGQRRATSGSCSDKYDNFFWQSHHSKLPHLCAAEIALPVEEHESASGRSTGVGNGGSDE